MIGKKLLKNNCDFFRVGNTNSFSLFGKVTFKTGTMYVKVNMQYSCKSKLDNKCNCLNIILSSIFLAYYVFTY